MGLHLPSPWASLARILLTRGSRSWANSRNTALVACAFKPFWGQQQWPSNDKVVLSAQGRTSRDLASPAREQAQRLKQSGAKWLPYTQASVHGKSSQQAGAKGSQKRDLLGRKALHDRLLTRGCPVPSPFEKGNVPVHSAAGWNKGYEPATPSVLRLSPPLPCEKGPACAMGQCDAKRLVLSSKRGSLDQAKWRQMAPLRTGLRPLQGPPSQ